MRRCSLTRVSPPLDRLSYWTSFNSCHNVDLTPKYHESFSMMNAQPCQKTLSITMQNRTGAVNRILDALSHRGIQPLAFLCTLSHDRQTVQVLVSFEFEDMAGFNKLVKSLQQQVLTLSVHPVISSREVAQGIETATREFLVTSEACKIANLAHYEAWSDSVSCSENAVSEEVRTASATASVRVL